MTGNDAIALLQRCKKTAQTTMKRPRLRKDDYAFLIRSYVQTLIPDVIEQVRETGDDPIVLLEKLYRKLELLLGESEDDAFITHNFTNHMMQSIVWILEYMKYHK